MASSLMVRSSAGVSRLGFAAGRAFRPTLAAPAPARRSVAAAASRLAGPQEVSKLVDSSWPYLDVRTPEEFAGGHVKDAVNVPLMFASGMGMAPNPNFLAAVKEAFPQKGSIVVGCKSGRRSAAAAAMLEGAGVFDEIVDLDGGWDAWAASGLPVAK